MYYLVFDKNLSIYVTQLCKSVRNAHACLLPFFLSLVFTNYFYVVERANFTRRPDLASEHHAKLHSLTFLLANVSTNNYPLLYPLR